jgi:spore coat protein U-like protein
MIRRIALLTAGMLLVSGLAFAQATTSATANAEILAAIELDWVQDLDFGTIASGSTGDSIVTIAATSLGERSRTGDALLIDTAQGAPAIFEVTAGLGLDYSLYFTDATITIADGAATMSVDLLIDSATGTGTGAAFEHYVGGELTVGPSQTPGTYTGTFQLNAIYQ